MQVFFHKSHQPNSKKKTVCLSDLFTPTKKPHLQKYMIGSFNSDPIRYSLRGQEVLRLTMAESFLGTMSCIIVRFRLADAELQMYSTTMFFYSSITCGEYQMSCLSIDYRGMQSPSRTLLILDSWLFLANQIAKIMVWFFLWHHTLACAACMWSIW